MKDNGFDESWKEFVMQDCPKRYKPLSEPMKHLKRDRGDFGCLFKICPCWDIEVSDDLDCRIQEVKEYQEDQGG